MNIKTTASLLFGILFLIWFAFLTWEHVKETEKENDDSSEDALSFRDRSVTVFPTSTLKGEDDEPDMIVNASFQGNRWRIGEPRPVEPENSSLPPFGKSTLRAIFGWKEEWHIRNSICGFVQNPKEIVSYEKKAGKTKVTFDSGWAIEINDATGQILVPPGLPPLSDNELADMTWRAFSANDGLERWRNVYRQVADDGTVLRELSDVILDEIRRVGDKAFVAWRLVETPPPDEDGFIRSVFWVDVRSRKIVYEGNEIHEDR